MQKFTDKRTITKMVNLDGWIIYRDSEYGMYARNEEKGLDIPLFIWNLTLNNKKLNCKIEIIRSDLKKVEEDN